jgi:hypothetical protein
VIVRSLEVVALARAIRTRLGLPCHDLSADEPSASASAGAATTPTSSGADAEFAFASPPPGGAAGQGTRGGKRGGSVAEEVTVTRTAELGFGPDGAPLVTVHEGAPRAQVRRAVPPGGEVTAEELVQLLTQSEEDAAADNSHGAGPRVEPSATDAADGSLAAALDPVVLTAAQTVLAAMVRPGGLAAALSPTAAARMRGEDVEPEAGDETPGPQPPAARRSLLDGRKHVLATLGKHGVLWLSGRPAPSDAIAGEAQGGWGGGGGGW